ncbi:hypothetical protein PVL29_009205 [Vitis rotundifolia]|uniref:Uncharacterized protein n=1 Tax=Vitis rotundifolia TaxID=103349 RepID=A0AA38ZXU3_VITRO|nr:hypothetical protein PVL29_009205 [Vitis rotundifolia]
MATQGRYGEGFSKDEVLAAIFNFGKNKINPWIQMVSNGFLHYFPLFSGQPNIPRIWRMIDEPLGSGAVNSKHPTISSFMRELNELGNFSTKFGHSLILRTWRQGNNLSSLLELGKHQTSHSSIFEKVRDSKDRKESTISP